MLRVAAILLLGTAACAPTSPTAPSTPLTFELDLREKVPLLTIKSTPEGLQKLKARYTSFKVTLGQPVDNVQFSVQQGYDGSLSLPWTIPLRNFSSPFPVRVIGTLPDGKEEVIHQDTF
jgi:hypothetical protein